MKSFNTLLILIVALTATRLTSADVNSQLASLQAQIDQLQTQINEENTSSILGLDPALSWQMMGNMTGVGKEMNLLKARQAGLSAPLTIGGYAEADMIYQHTNSTGPNNAAEFNLIPLSNGAAFNSTTGNSATNLFMSNVNLAVTAAIGSWVTGYIQTGAQNVGSANTSSNNLSIQDAYFVAGNLSENPLYAYAGKKDIDFGNFTTVNMYYAPLTREFFEPIGDTAGLGVNAQGFNGTISLMNGNTDGTNSNMYTTHNNFADNYALNAAYGMNSNGVSWNLGAGYLAGSRFLTTSQSTNGAWDINGKISINAFDFLAEYVATTSKSYGATAFTPALSTTAQNVSIWDLGADYHFILIRFNSSINVDYSQANLANGSANLLQQFVAGYRIEPFDNVWTGIEYAYNKNGINAATASLYGSGYHSSTLLLDLSAAF